MKNLPYKTVLIGIIVLVLILVLPFVSKNQKITKNSIVVGVSPDYPPFEYTKDGNIIGFDIDLIHAIGKKIDKKIIIREMEFSSLLTALNTGKVDIIISSISKNFERAENIAFSKPYYTSTFSIVTLENSTIKKLDDLSQNAKVGVQTGSIMESFINNYNYFTNKELQIFSLGSNLFLFEKLKMNKVEALVLENVQASTFCQNILGLKFQSIEDDVYTDGNENSYVIGIKKSNDLLKEINDGINYLNHSGQMVLLKQKWNLG